MKPWLKILLTVLVTGAVFGGSTYYFVNAKATDDKNNLQSQIDDLNTKLVTAQQSLTDAQILADETVDWKTYTSSTYGFSFKYPIDWTLVSPETVGSDSILIAYATNQKGDAYLSSGEATVSFTLRKNKTIASLQADNAAEILKSGETISNSETIINNIAVPTYSIIWVRPDEGEPGSNTEYYFARGNDVLEIATTVVTDGSISTGPITKNIASSIRFVN